MAKDLVRTRRHIHKFYQMKTQLQAVSLRIQTLRSNQQMAEAMRGATRVSFNHHHRACAACRQREAATDAIDLDYTLHFLPRTLTGDGHHEP